MYHSNTKTNQTLKNVSINIVPNPLANIQVTNTSKVKRTGIPDLVASTQLFNSTQPPKSGNTQVNMPNEVSTEKSKTGLPFVVPSFQRSKVNIPVVDFRYFSNTPVYQETTLPLTTVTRKHTPLTVYHGLVFSLIIIVGTILGAFAGYGLYKAFQ